MSQLVSRLNPSLRTEWKLFDQRASSALEFLSLCEKMISVGEFLLAHDVAKAGLKLHKNDRKLCQKAAHALCKAGSPMMASQLLEELVASGDRGVETTVYLPVHTKIFGNRLPMPSPKINMRTCHC